MEAADSGWSQANLQRLLTGMKGTIPKHKMRNSYLKGLKTLDWKKVSFPPFSPEECKQKWTEMFHNMRRTRTLTELIEEAEDTLLYRFRDKKIYPGFPKRPSRPNAIYYKENWAKFHKKHPEMSIPQLFKYVIKKYSGLPNEQKAQYVEKFNLANEEYKRRRQQEFRKQHNVADCLNKTCKTLSGNTTVVKKAVGLPPKPPLNGYQLFCKEQMSCMKGTSSNNYVSVWAQRWRVLSQTQRDQFATRCTQLKRQYAVDVTKYLNRFDEEERHKIIATNRIKIPKVPKRTTSRVKKLPGEPKMPSQSGNVVFCKKRMEVLKEKIPNSRERFVEANKMWRHLSTEEKKSYTKNVCEKLQKYSLGLQKWFKTLTAKEQKDFVTHNPSKLKYLDAKESKAFVKEQPCLSLPSDSEDEDILISSTDEEKPDCYEDEEEEEEEEEEEHFEGFL